MCTSRSLSILNAINLGNLEWKRETEPLVRVQPYPVVLMKLILRLGFPQHTRRADSSTLTTKLCCSSWEPSRKACRTTALLRTLCVSHYKSPSQPTTASACPFNIALPNPILIRGAGAHTESCMDPNSLSQRLGDFPNAETRGPQRCRRVFLSSRPTLHSTTKRSMHAATSWWTVGLRCFLHCLCDRLMTM